MKRKDPFLSTLPPLLLTAAAEPLELPDAGWVPDELLEEQFLPEPKKQRAQEEMPMISADIDYQIGLMEAFADAPDWGAEESKDDDMEVEQPVPPEEPPKRVRQTEIEDFATRKKKFVEQTVQNYDKDWMPLVLWQSINEDPYGTAIKYLSAHRAKLVDIKLKMGPLTKNVIEEWLDSAHPKWRAVRTCHALWRHQLFEGGQTYYAGIEPKMELLPFDQQLKRMKDYPISTKDFLEYCLEKDDYDTSTSGWKNLHYTKWGLAASSVNALENSDIKRKAFQLTDKELKIRKAAEITLAKAVIEDVNPDAKRKPELQDQMASASKVLQVYNEPQINMELAFNKKRSREEIRRQEKFDQFKQELLFLDFLATNPDASLEDIPSAIKDTYSYVEKRWHEIKRASEALGFTVQDEEPSIQNLISIGVQLFPIAVNKVVPFLKEKDRGALSRDERIELVMKTITEWKGWTPTNRRAYFFFLARINKFYKRVLENSRDKYTPWSTEDVERLKDIFVRVTGVHKGVEEGSWNTTEGLVRQTYDAALGEARVLHEEWLAKNSIAETAKREKAFLLTTPSHWIPLAVRAAINEQPSPPRIAGDANVAQLTAELRRQGDEAVQRYIDGKDPNSYRFQKGKKTKARVLQGLLWLPVKK